MSAAQTMVEDIESSPPTSPPKKRPAEEDLPEPRLLNLKGTQFMMPTPPDTEESSNASSNTSENHNREGSPAPSCSTLTSMDTTSHIAQPPANADGTVNGSASASGPSAKRRKLTPAEKLEKQQEKESKAREKAEERARKDEEKRMKDLEKQKKAEEREAKKREKELEEEQRAQAKLKKDRSQMRLGAFFGAKPATPVKDATAGEGSSVFARRKSLSLEPFDAVSEQIRPTISPAKPTPLRTQSAPEQKSSASEAVTVLSDYHRTFLPFVLPSHSTSASRFTAQGVTESGMSSAEFDQLLPTLTAKSTACTLDQWFPRKSLNQRGITLPRVRELADAIVNNSSQTVDLTREGPMDMLRKVPIKLIHFGEDVRPAYCGTYTKIEDARVARAPFTRARPDTDYNYDSEAEWEEPEEGEDIVSEDEDDVDSQADGDEIEGFLDDSEDLMKNKRRMITGDLVPEMTGLCWQNAAGKPSSNDARPDMHGMSLGFLVPGFKGTSIDPFATHYWEPEAAAAKPDVIMSNTQCTIQGGALAPPRPPLQPRTSNTAPDRELVGAAEGLKGPINSVDGVSGAKRPKKQALKPLSKEDLDEFKDAVVGSSLGKLDLLKGLKSRFPKMTHDVIKDTLGQCFAQIGVSKANKRWVFVEPS